MAGQLVHHRRGLVRPVFPVRLAENRLRPRFMHHVPEHEATGDRHRPAWGHHPAMGPAGKGLGEHDDVGLRVSTVDSQWVQLQDFPRQILVECPPGATPGRGFGTDRRVVVEIGHHGDMAGDGDQHVLESAEDVRTNGLAFIGRQCRSDDRLGPRYGEMARPEEHHALGERGVRPDDVPRARRNLGSEGLPVVPARHLVEFLGAFDSRFMNVLRDGSGAREGFEGGRNRLTAHDLPLDSAPWSASTATGSRGPTPRPKRLSATREAMSLMAVLLLGRAIVANAIRDPT